MLFYLIEFSHILYANKSVLLCEGKRIRALFSVPVMGGTTKVLRIASASVNKNLQLALKCKINKFYMYLGLSDYNAITVPLSIPNQFLNGLLLPNVML